MNNFGKRLILILILFNIIAVANAYVYEKPISIGVLGNGFRLLDGTRNDSAFRAWSGIKFGYDLNPHFSAEIRGGWGYTVIRDKDQTIEILRFLIADEDLPFKTTILPVEMAVRYNLDNKSHVIPYLEGGMGAFIWNVTNTFTSERMTSGTNFTANIGAGIEFELSRTVGLQLGVNYLRLFNQDSDMSGMGDICESKIDLRIGVNFRFASRKDSDNDGILDRVDLAPFEAEDFDGFEDDDGRPEWDNDLDGIADNLDLAPLQAEDFDGFQDDDGIPDIDNDGDGILDKFDASPNEAEDFDGYKDGDGIPDLDNDGDGIPDEEDKAPNRPETYNDYQDNDGIPDIKPEIIFKKKTAVILEGVTFLPGKSTLTSMAKVVLGKVAKTMLADPIMNLEISGHTDNIGSRKSNQQLSLLRVKAVKQYLTDLGVAKDRLKAIGLGPDYPIDTNETEIGRAKNRRIEFYRTR